MPQHTRHLALGAVAALAVGAAGFAIGNAQDDGAAGATTGETRILKSIEVELKTLNSSIGRTEAEGMRDDLDDAKDTLEKIESNTRR